MLMGPARFFAVSVGICVAASCVGAALAVSPSDHRLGFVTIKFDDGSIEHYTHVLPLLKAYGVKATFCINAGKLAAEPGGNKITAEQCLEIYNAGHEIIDHSLNHEAAIWGDAGNVEEWSRRIEASLKIFRELGITIHGWSLPGGKGAVYNQRLHDMMSTRYEWARGGNCDLGYKPFDVCWNFCGDPHAFTGSYWSWESSLGKGHANATREMGEKALALWKTTRADLVQRGLLVGFTMHRTIDKNQGKWAVEQMCKWIAESKLPTATYHEALQAFRSPRDHYPVDIQQIPCADFRYDLDHNGRPDGWENCSFAPDDVKSPGSGRVAELQHNTKTMLYGPEPGKTAVSFLVKSSDDTPRKVTLRLDGVTILSDFRRSPKAIFLRKEILAGADWQEINATVDVPARTEYCRIAFSVPDRGAVLVVSPSWRRIVNE